MRRNVMSRVKDVTTIGTVQDMVLMKEDVANALTVCFNAQTIVTHATQRRNAAMATLTVQKDKMR